MKWEYAYFTVRVPYVGPVSDLDKWPAVTMIDALLIEMNRLGAEGWEIFERAHPVTIALGPSQLYPYTLWARRPIQVASTSNEKGKS
jgi:hypothetical protein